MATKKKIPTRKVPSTERKESQRGNVRPPPRGRESATPKPQPWEKARASDEKRAETVANKFYSEGALGRISAPEKLGRIAPSSAISLISTDMQGGQQSIAQTEDAYNKAQIRDKYVEAALQNMQAGLGGYGSAENQALRAQAAREGKGQTARALRSLRGFQADNGVSGDTATYGASNILRGEASDRARQETDILAKNVEEQRIRGNAFADASMSADVNFNNFKDTTLARLLGARRDVADYTMNAQKANQEAQQQNIENTYRVDSRNQDADKYNIEAAQNTALANLAQAEKEKQGWLGAYYGDQGASEARRTAQLNQEDQRRLMEIAKRGVR